KGRSLHMLHLSDMRAETVTHAEDALPAAALLASRIRKDLHQLVHIFMNRRPVGMAADDRANLSRQEVERRRQRLEDGRALSFLRCLQATSELEKLECVLVDVQIHD